MGGDVPIMMDESHPADSGADASAGVSRRRFLGSAATTLGVVGVADVLAACAGGSDTAKPGTGTGSAVTNPSRGGSLRFGATGGANSDTLEAQAPITLPDFARVGQLYDSLLEMTPDGKGVDYRLATEITPNADATEWTITVRKGVVTHEGKPFGAKDVLFSLKRIVHNKFPGAFSLGPVDFGRSRVLDTHTLRLAYHQPYAILLDALTIPYYAMVPEGYDPKHPVGTGPFRLKSFQAGVQSTMARFEDYWREGLPYLDEVRTIDIADEETQLNGLLTGQFDVVNAISAASVKVVAANPNCKTILSQTGSFTPFTMRCDIPPFNDVRVRQAFRLMVNRPEMNEQVWNGLGKLGNDMINIVDPDYLRSEPQRVQDIEQAKHLLKAAGAEGISVELVSTELVGGATDTAQVFTAQSKAAGVHVSLNVVNVTDFFGKYYLKSTFSQSWWYYAPSLVIVQQAWATPNAPFNETRFHTPQYTRLFNEATRTTDQGKRHELKQDMMRIEYNEGGYIIPYFIPVVDASSTKVAGIASSASGQSLNNYQFAEIGFV